MPTDNEETGILNLSTVRKNARAPKGAKPGRKRPRIGDDDPPIESKQQVTEQQEQNTEHAEQHMEYVEQQTEQAEHHAEHQVEQHTEHPMEQVEKHTVLNDSLRRDKLYSQEVWVPADGSIIR